MDLAENATASLQASWQRAWSRLGVPAPDVLPCLQAAYAEPQRHYHSLQHLAECVDHFAGSQALASRPGEVEIAIWFHDAVYDVYAKDNELRSAQWATQVLQAAGCSTEVCTRVDALIMATCHHARPADGDAALLVDIDLAILGSDAMRFAEYETQVRAEYAWVPAAVYASKRAQVLHGFLQRDAIYTTAGFRHRLESIARQNLASSLATCG